jgi:hypothetical protein
VKAVLIILLLFWTFAGNAQEENTLSYNLYKDKIVLYGDLGFNSAPFSIKNNFPGGIDKISFKHNQKVVLGFGINYKWFGLRLGLSLPGHLRPVSKYGVAEYQDLGVKFNIKKTFWDIDLRNYLGYVIQDAYKWNDTLNALQPNSHVNRTRSVNFSINTWKFRSDQFKMPAVLGKVGDYKHNQGTFYLKYTFNFFGIGNDYRPLAPIELIETDTIIDKSSAKSLTALDFGFVPGYAYVHRWNNWQASVFGGLGGVVQAKFFDAGNQPKGSLGLAPRIDVRLVVGYSKPKYFFWFTSEFDVKSIRIQELRMNQVYQSFKIIGGVRLNKKDKDKKEKRKSKQKDNSQLE